MSEYSRMEAFEDSLSRRLTLPQDAVVISVEHFAVPSPRYAGQRQDWTIYRASKDAFGKWFASKEWQVSALPKAQREVFRALLYNSKRLRRYE